MGLFVFSARTAPPGLEPFGRYGDDIVIVWDADDPRSDVTLMAGLSVAKALCARARISHATEEADFEAMERSILEIERQITGLDEIAKYAGTIKSGGEKIVDRARIIREAVYRQVAELQARVGEVRAVVIPTVTALSESH